MNVTTTEISAALGVSLRCIRQRAQRQDWNRIGRLRDGGNVYELSKLPADIQSAIAELRKKEIVATLPAANPEISALANYDYPSIRGQLIPLKPQAPVAMSDKQKEKAMAKWELVRVYTGFLGNAGWKNKVPARDEFISRYKAGEWPQLRELTGDVSWKTIESWKVALKRHNGDPLILADSRGGSTRGMTKLTSEQMEILRSFALHPNKMRISHAITWAKRVMRERGIDSVSDATCRRYILSIKTNDYPSWVFYREGEQALENKCGYTIDRDWDKVEVGELLTADGHVMNFEVLNPWTGKPCRPVLVLWYDTRSNMPLGWELMPTENTQSIHVALRRAIITLGKVPKVAYLDNGKAFRAKHFTNSADFDNGAISGLYSRLGIQTSFATPYHGQAKTVERFFGSLLEVESIMPTYTGNSIDNKPARLHRGESLHRKLWERYGMGQNVLTIVQAHHIIAAWFDEYAQRPQRGHLNGKSPIEVFNAGKGSGVDKAELTELMMSVKITKVKKTGIRMFDRNYYHPAMYGRRNPLVVRFDVLAQECIYLYEPNGEFIGVAEEKTKTHPAARLLGSEKDREILKKELATKNRIKTMTVKPARELLKTEILPVFKQLSSELGIESEKQPLAGPDRKVIALRGKAKQVEKAEDFDFEAAKKEAEENIRRQKEVEAREFRANLDQLDESDRYEELVKLCCQGMSLDADLIGFMSMYEQTSEHQRFADYWDQCWTKYRLMYRSSDGAQAI